MEEAVAFRALQRGHVFRGEAGFRHEFAGELFDGLHVCLKVFSPVGAELPGGGGDVVLFRLLHGGDDAGDVFSGSFAVESGFSGLFGEEGFEFFRSFEVFRQFKSVGRFLLFRGLGFVWFGGRLGLLWSGFRGSGVRVKSTSPDDSEAAGGGGVWLPGSGNSETSARQRRV